LFYRPPAFPLQAGSELHGPLTAARASPNRGGAVNRIIYHARLGGLSARQSASRVEVWENPA
jgi:hypothetical protein